MGKNVPSNQPVYHLDFPMVFRYVKFLPSFLAKTTSASVKTTAPPPSGQCSRSVRGCWPPPCLPATYPRKKSTATNGGKSKNCWLKLGAWPLEGRGFFCDQRGVMDHVWCARANRNLFDVVFQAVNPFSGAVFQNKYFALFRLGQN